MQEELKIKDIIGVLKKRIKSIVLITSFIGILSFILNYYIATPIYESSIRIFIGAKASTTEQLNINDVTAYKDLMTSFEEIINSSDLIDECIDKYNINRSNKDIVNNLTIKAISDTQVLEITYKDTDRDIVNDVLESISNEFIDEIEEITPGGKAKLIDSVQVPDTPSSPKKIFNILASVFLGVILSCILALFSENFNDKVKSINQIENLLGIDIIGVIPIYKRKKGEI